MTERPPIYADTDSPPEVVEQLRAAIGLTIGDRVVIRGGFEDGIHGTIVANEPHDAQSGPGAFYVAPRPYRLRVRIRRCPYCGTGKCSGSARTANGRDVERWHAIHTADHPNPGTIGGLAPVNVELEPDDPGPRSHAEALARTLHHRYRNAAENARLEAADANTRGDYVTAEHARGRADALAWAAEVVAALDYFTNPNTPTEEIPE